jgi:putative FmdB family regulatory protein
VRDAAAPRLTGARSNAPVPIYDYVCSKCHRLTEVVHGIAADGPTFCPECGAMGTMTKVITAPSVHFKGSGWAKKDRSSSSRAAARSTEGGSSTDARSDSSASDDNVGPAKDATAKDATAKAGPVKAGPAPKSEGSGSSASPQGSGSPSGGTD